MFGYQPQQGELINEGKLTYLATTGKKLFILDQWLEYRDWRGKIWVVPKGFVNDLASVPGPIFWLQFGPWHVSGVLHDWLYIFGCGLQIVDGELEEIPVSKLTADRLFADLNRTLGVSPLSNKLMYIAVRLFGRGVWTKNFEPRYGKTLEELKLAFEDFKATGGHPNYNQEKIEGWGDWDVLGDN